MAMTIKGYTRACLWSDRRLIYAKGFDEASVMPPDELRRIDSWRINPCASCHPSAEACSGF
jgi:hypothetical protein